jgi:hypothetical protein
LKKQHPELDFQGNSRRGIGSRYHEDPTPDVMISWCPHQPQLMHVGGKPYVMATQWLAAVRTSLLKHRVGNLGAEQTEIANALDMLFTGI